MRWDSSDSETENFDDLRGRGGSTGRRVAIGGGTVVVALVLALLGAPKQLIQSVLSGGGSSEVPTDRAGSAEEVDPARAKDEAPLVSLARRVMADTEVVWSKILGSAYHPPRLGVFWDQVASACGEASSAVGPFYCPGDQRVYIDLGFYRELDRRFGAPGDFAQAYVLAHEVGHHVQTLTGTSRTVARQRSSGSEVEANHLSVLQELQADCYAGVWAHHADQSEHRLQAGDVEEGLRAAAAIGDDTLQKQSRGRVMPDSFTHGTSAQRVEWLKRGLASGNMKDCDTFAAAGLR